MDVFLLIFGILGWIAAGGVALGTNDPLTEIMAGIGAISSTVMFVGGNIIFAINRLRATKPAPKLESSD